MSYSVENPMVTADRLPGGMDNVADEAGRDSQSFTPWTTELVAVHGAVESTVLGLESTQHQSQPSEIEKPLLTREVVHDIARREVCAHEEAPTNYHQATVYTVLIDDNASEKEKRRMLFYSWLLVILQTVSASANLVGFISPVCSNNVTYPSPCQRGYYCETAEGYGDVGWCKICYSNTPSAVWAPQNETKPIDSFWQIEQNGTTFYLDEAPCLRYYHDHSFFDIGYHEYFGQITWGEREDAWRFRAACDDCRAGTPERPIDAVLTMQEVIWAKASRLRIMEYIMVVFCMGLAALFTSAEIRDIDLTVLIMLKYVERQGESLSNIWFPKLLCSKIERRCQLQLLLMLAAIRQVVTTVLLTCSIPFIVVCTNASVSEVAGSTLAFLFLLEVDTAVFKFGVSERSRSMYEERAKVRLNENEAYELSKKKQVFASLIFIAQVVGVSWMGYTGDITLPCHITSSTSIILAGFISDICYSTRPLGKSTLFGLIVVHSQLTGLMIGLIALLLVVLGPAHPGSTLAGRTVPRLQNFFV